MSRRHEPHRRGRPVPYLRAGRPRRWWTLAAALLLVAVSSLTLGLRGHHHALAPPLTSPSTTPGASPRVTGSALPRSAPVTIRIPSISVDATVTQLGLNADGTVQVPTNFQQAGWYRLGPSPGQLGSAVILGHVDSYKGPAVFFRLRLLHPGDAVEVTLADGSTAHFVVNMVATYSKAQFPADVVYGSHGYSGLQLVTCGGTFDTHARSYLSNVVVYTALADANAPS